ncbi:glycoside hydrolase family 92 protein [Lentinula aciculospora]|uniref:Glycoside hydrolase family 92 protein n=1 Tax=Lentinula aciculospora TaxID=153920 RepID=A0A9W9DGV2_9AGAR|nr:glycoside hydrolase family 92 protein [Lentinula aciculospora]
MYPICIASLLSLSSLTGTLAYEWPKYSLYSVNPLIGSAGPEPNLSGGMIPSVAPPFGSTRWVAQNQNSYVSATPFNYTESYMNNGTIHGFMGTRQPAIWMGESAWAAIVPGISSGSEGDIKAGFEERGLPKAAGTEKFGVGLYSVELAIPDSGGSTVHVSMSASSRVGHFLFTFNQGSESEYQPYIFLPTTRAATIFHNPNIFDITYPNGTVHIFPLTSEICGSNTEMQDFILAPNSIKDAANHFTGWYCAIFDTSFNDTGYGVTVGSGDSTMRTEWADSGSGEELGAYARFRFPSSSGTQNNIVTVNVRIATSLISMEQARYNLNANSTNEFGSFNVQETQSATENAWAEKVGRFQVETDGSSDSEEKLAVFLTGVFHAMQYPYEVHEPIPTSLNAQQYYSAYDNAVHEGESYSGYSIWDTYRAEWGLLILLAPERIPGMVRSMLQDYEEGGWLPMWKNIIETNIMVGTHADSLLAEAVLKGFGAGSTEENGLQTTFTTDELTTMWKATWKDASVPPMDDLSVVYSDREEDVDYEVRAGLSTFFEQYATGQGWVANDIHSESVSRTLDYAYDDHAVAVLSTLIPLEIVQENTPKLDEIATEFYANKNASNGYNVTTLLNDRSMANPWTVWNATASSPAVITGGEDIKGFVQAREQNGDWAATTDGFTEGDRWVYSFAYVHDVAELVTRRGGNESFVKSLNEFYDGGWVDFTNEPAHHTPYLYALAGAASYTQERVREIAKSNYNNTPNGLSGNEDCGQMSAWYVFSAMGFYPVNPVSGVYVVGSPFFSSLTVSMPVPPFITPSHSSITSNPYYNSTTNSFDLRISAPGAETKPYVKSLKVNGRVIADGEEPLISHEEIRFGGLIEFEMSDQVENWGGGRGAWVETTSDAGNSSTTYSFSEQSYSSTVP